MAGARITVGFDDAATVARLRRLGAMMVNTTPIMQAVGTVLVRNTEDRLGQGFAPDGTAWAPLNAAYASVKRGPGILVASGMLRRSITYAAGHNNVVVGTNRIYGGIQQFGGVIRPNKARALVFRLGGRLVHARSVRIPARPYLGISATDRRDVIETIDGFVQRSLGLR